MVTLAAILDEARDNAFSGNSTVLNSSQFHTIRAPSSGAFRERLDSALAGSTDLSQIQQLNAEEGLEVIEPVRAGIHGGYWYLRNLSHRGETFPAGECQYTSIADALVAAIEWWQGETWCRGIMVRAFDINHDNRRV